MKIIIPFKKEVVFKDNINEITSISLEHQLELNDYLVKGNFLITGEYKVSDNSKTVLPFNLELPIALSIEDRYNIEKAVCDIDDFYYEIINNRKLGISIDISVDKLEENEVHKIEDKIDTIDERCIDIDTSDEENTRINEKETKIEEIASTENVKDNMNTDKVEEVNKKIKTLFNTDSNNDEYITYQIYIIREGDTVDSIIAKYDIDVESLKEYNDISDLKLGDKIIIPNYERN